MAKFEATANRIFNRVFVCRRCMTKTRVDIKKVLAKAVVCKKCGMKNFRPIKKTK